MSYVQFKSFVKYLPFAALLIVLVGLSVFFASYISPEQLITHIGINNSYLVISLLAFLSGLLTFSLVPYHVVLVALAVGGLNPLLLGLVTTIGIMLGDSVSYYLGYQGRVIIPVRFQSLFKKIHLFGTGHPRLFPFIFFLYGAIVPFSNDFIGISMGLIRYPFWRVIIPLGLGNLVFNSTLAFFATRVISIL
ncbi:MAG: hypothetical protein WC757_02245 [Candidatus Paceibacterota bacterium]